MATPTDAVRSTLHDVADAATSATRAATALTLLATARARQAMGGGTTPAADGPSVEAAARARLHGGWKTAYVVGANVQSGLVDAAAVWAGSGPQGETPSGDTSGLSIPWMDRAMRRVTGVRTVATGALERPVPQSEMIARLREYHAEATRGAVDRVRAVTGLWKSEGLATSLGKHLHEDNTLADAALPREVLPILHVGFGSGSTEALRFDAAALLARFEQRAHPQYREFCVEGIGAILRIYERGLFKVMSGALGLIPLDAEEGPEPAHFFAAYLEQYTPEQQWLIAHGYGRIVAFSNIDIYTALSQATAFPAARVEPAVHGCGFAFGFMNSADMPRLLAHSDVPFSAPVRAAFQNGLVSSLVFFDWYMPGLLEGWTPVAPLEAELVAQARQEAEAARTRGYPLAFRLAAPRT